MSGGAFDPEPRTVTYAYDNDGHLTTLGYPDGTSVNYEYEAHGWLSQILAEGGEASLASYEYDAMGNPTQMLRDNTIVTTKAFDDEDHITSIIDKAATAQVPLNQLSYQYDAVGSRTEAERFVSLEGNAVIQTKYKYTYDQIHQVIGSESAEGAVNSTVQFSYDPLGNRTEVDANGTITHYAANELNQYTQIGERAPSHDSNGNLAEMGEWHYQYDALNRLVLATNEKITARFWYDARNRVVAHSYQASGADKPTLTLNTYDDWNLIEERDATDTKKARYIHGPRIDEIVLTKNEYGDFYPQYDALGSVTMLTDTDGKLAEHYSYSVTGETTIYDANGAELSSSAIGNRWLFTGREFSPEIDL